MSQLWTPPSGPAVPARQPRRAPMPQDNIDLADGRRLLDQGLYYHHGQTGRHWKGPHRLLVLATIDDTDRFGPLLHVSLSYPNRDPDWATIKAVRAAFFPPTIDVMMLLPRAEDYVAGIPAWPDSHVFHLIETPERWGYR